MSEPVALSPCPFCKGGEFRFDESTHWTGRGSELLNVKLRHWCERRPNCPPSTIELVAKTEDEVRDLWNRRTHPSSERVRELVEVAQKSLSAIRAEAEMISAALAAIAAEGLKEGER